MAIKLTRKKLLRIVVIAAIAVILAGIIVLLCGILNPDTPVNITSTRIGIIDNGSVRPFGNRILYYDGSSIYCFTSGGAEIWHYDIGADAWFDCNDSAIVAWHGSNISVLNTNGEPTYSDSLDGTIQFARIGKQYIAIVIGDSTSPELLIKDHTGAQMDSEDAAYEGLVLMDTGFYGKDGQYVWTTAIDVYGTAANITLSTYEPGKLTTCTTSLGSSICYGVVYENSRLHTIDTRKIRSFSDNGTEDSSESILVYGWHYLDSLVPERGRASYLFAPETQANSSQYEIRQLRLLKGSTDIRYTLPETCVGAALYGNYLFAVSSSQLYRASASSTRFESWQLPSEVSPLTLIGTLSGSKALISGSDAIYVINLPE